jgi:DNA-directed RNA polymerase subunit RPC12/RpoP
LCSDAVLATLGAWATGRPVTVALPRPLMPNNTTHRPATILRVRLGAGKARHARFARGQCDARTRADRRQGRQFCAINDPATDMPVMSCQRWGAAMKIFGYPVLVAKYLCLRCGYEFSWMWQSGESAGIDCSRCRHHYLIWTNYTKDFAGRRIDD